MDLGLAGRVGVLAGDGGPVAEATAEALRAEGAEVLDDVGPGPVDFLVNVVEDPSFEGGVMEPMRAMRALAPRLAERGRGRIVNVLATADPVTGAAALSLSRLFADRYAGQGVLVNAVRPAAGADPETVAREVAFLCSAPASHIAGATWPVPAAGAID
jgi:NAD(P)-dependent dehydrogenase (short-subunit alcohol dehydrogenase family)